MHARASAISRPLSKSDLYHVHICDEEDGGSEKDPHISLPHPRELTRCCSDSVIMRNSSMLLPTSPSSNPDELSFIERRRTLGPDALARKQQMTALTQFTGFSSGRRTVFVPRRLQTIFQQLTSEGRDTLCLESFRESALKLELDLDGEEVDRVWAAIDTKNSGEITFDQFCFGIKQRSFLKNLLNVVHIRSHMMEFKVPKNFDYLKPTCENYSAGPDEPYVGPFRETRMTRDSSYHGRYTKERQLWQDSVVQCVVHKTSINLRPWLIFTAGTPGAGKGHVMRWLSNNEYLPLEEVVHIDPDYFKRLMPEWKKYVELSDENAGTLTHKESGFIQELCLEVALRYKQNTWVDGSLQSGEFYKELFQDVRERFPEYRIAIFYIYASEAVVRERCIARAKTTGRAIPEATINQGMKKPWMTLQMLTPLCDFLASIKNDDEPKLETFQRIDRSGDCLRIRKTFARTAYANEFPYSLPPLFVTTVWSRPFGTGTSSVSTAGSIGSRITDADILHNKTANGVKCSILISGNECNRYVASPPTEVEWSQKRRGIAGVPEEAKYMLFLCREQGVGPPDGFGTFANLVRARSTHGAMLFYDRNGAPLCLNVLHFSDVSVKRLETKEMFSLNYEVPYKREEHKSYDVAFTFGPPELITATYLQNTTDRVFPCLQQRLRERGAREVGFVRPGELKEINNADAGFVYTLTESSVVFFPIDLIKEFG
eukprot:GEMP01007617.1.p1 GENE.GEMP01007617.1~~GEMP01007617.1.p1  ORF type:complete len:714 (+),score=128.89 GEMP01007617.1:215-2356(+)